MSQETITGLKKPLGDYIDTFIATRDERAARGGLIAKNNIVGFINYLMEEEGRPAQAELARRLVVSPDRIKLWYKDLIDNKGISSDAIEQLSKTHALPNASKLHLYAICHGDISKPNALETVEKYFQPSNATLFEVLDEEKQKQTRSAVWSDLRAYYGLVDNVIAKISGYAQGTIANITTGKTGYFRSSAVSMDLAHIFLPNGDEQQRSKLAILLNGSSRIYSPQHILDAIKDERITVPQAIYIARYNHRHFVTEAAQSIGIKESKYNRWEREEFTGGKATATNTKAEEIKNLLLYMGFEKDSDAYIAMESHILGQPLISYDRKIIQEVLDSVRSGSEALETLRMTQRIHSKKAFSDMLGMEETYYRKLEKKGRVSVRFAAKAIVVLQIPYNDLDLFLDAFVPDADTGQRDTIKIEVAELRMPEGNIKLAAPVEQTSDDNGPADVDASVDEAPAKTNSSALSEEDSERLRTIMNREPFLGVSDQQCANLLYDASESILGEPIVIDVDTIGKLREGLIAPDQSWLLVLNEVLLLNLDEQRVLRQISSEADIAKSQQEMEASGSVLPPNSATPGTTLDADDVSLQGKTGVIKLTDYITGSVDDIHRELRRKYHPTTKIEIAEFMSGQRPPTLQEIRVLNDIYRFPGDVLSALQEQSVDHSRGRK